MEFINLNKMKNFEARVRRESEMKFYNLVKVGPVRAEGREGPTAALCSHRIPQLPKSVDSIHLPAHFTDGPMEAPGNLCMGAG